jgi:hypothetical protein
VTDLDPSLLRELQADPTDPEAVWEELLRRGWSDGLPVIPPTPDRVARMLGGRDPAAVHVRLGPEGNEATLARVAANAVMAGCGPEHLPAVLAALSVAGANGGMAFSSSSAAPMLVFNGAVRTELGINCSYEMLSMTTRANATIGRAIRLVLANVGQAKVGRLFDVQHGMPGRLSMVFGEHEEESPWEPHSVSAAGLAPGRSAVTVFLATGSMPVNYHQVPQRAGELLLILTRCLDYVRGNRIGPTPDSGGPVVVLSPKHARAFSKEGWTKERLATELTEAVNQHWDVELEAHRDKLELINRGLDPDDPRMSQPKPEGPVEVLVAGGPAGWHSLLVPTLAWGTPVTVPVDG